MTPRTLKEVAQAGLVLGFEWIAKDDNGDTNLYKVKPTRRGFSHWLANGQWALVKITDYPDLPPERSLLRLRDIVEDNK